MDISDGRGSKGGYFVSSSAPRERPVRPRISPSVPGFPRPRISPDFPRFGSAPSSITEYSSSVGRTSLRPAVRGLTPFPGLLLRWLALRVRAILAVSDRDFVGLESLCAVLSVALDIYGLT